MVQHNHPRTRERGAALLLVLLFLGVLSSLGIGLYSIVRLERLAALNHLSQARARLVAEAGIQRAIAQLSESELDDPTGAGALWRVRDPGVPIERSGDVLRGAPSRPDFAFTGNLGGTFSTSGDRFVVRVADTSSKIDLHARPEVVGPALDALGRAIALERARTGAGADDPIKGRAGAIAAFVAARGRLSSVRELAAVIGAADARALGDFVTVHGELDPRTWRATGERDARGYPLIVREPRAPICANTASFPVLVAVFEGVTGRDGVPVTFAQAVLLARWIVAWRESTDLDRGALTTWEKLARLMDGAALDAGLTRAQKSAVLANASPNFSVGELNPDAVSLRLGDAGALVRGTTELSLFTSGVYEIDSLGRVLGPDESVVVGESALRAVVRIFEVARHTTQEDFGRGTGEGIAVLPLPRTEPAAAFSGYVQLKLHEPAEPPSGAVVDFSSSFAPVTFGKGTMLGASGAKVCAPALATATDPRPVANQAKVAVGTRASGPAGRLHADGFRASKDAAVCRYNLGATADHGSLAFWLKLGLEETPGVIFETEETLTDAYAIQSRLIAGRSGEMLSLDYERKLVRVVGPSPPEPPTSVSATRTRVVLGSLGAAHEWHHVVVAWRDGLEHTLSLDGQDMPAQDATPLDPAALEVIGPPRDAITVGGGLDGAPGRADATIDDLVLDDSARPETGPADRYGQDGLVTGRFQGAFDDFLAEAHLGVFAWTAQQPGRWGRVSFQADEFALLIALSNGGQTVKLQGDGSPVKMGKWNNGKGSGAQKPKPGKPKKSKSQEILSATFPAVATTDELPRIVHSGGSVTYEFQFVYDRGAFAERGLAAPPLAVSPVLEDVTLTYTRGPRVLRQEPLD